MDVAIAVTAAILLGEAAAYIWAFMHLRRRTVAESHATAWAGFLGWWLGTALSSIITAVRHAVFLAGNDDAMLHATGVYAVLIVSYLGTAGLLVYLFTLVQGFKPWQWVWYGVAVVVLVQGAVIIFGADPVAAVASGATLGMEYAQPLSPWLGLSALPFVLLPLGLLATLAIQSRLLDDVGKRSRRFAALLAAWIITKSALSAGALGLYPPAISWAARVLAIVAALALVRFVIAPDRARRFQSPSSA